MSFATDTLAAMPGYVREADAGQGDALARFLAGPCGQVQPCVDWLAAPTVDPATCAPALLPWVGAMAGVDTTGVASSDVRAFIGNWVTRRRGSVSSIAYRVGLTLTGNRTVTIDTYYGGDPLAMRITTYTAETPSADATEAAARLEVPAWIALTVRVIDGWTYTELATHYATYSAMTATGYTYEDLMGMI